jgi:choline dehydrogenase-like flavoprotein
MANEKVDVVIVGAGASGSVYAAVMARAGKQVVLLEAGPDWQLGELISSDFWGRRIKPAGPPFLLEGKNPFGYVYQAGWGVGGAALHYFANFPRLMPADFKVKSEHGKGLDWPIKYTDVAPFYDKVARDVGVSGDAKAEEIWRPAGEPYPMPPMKTFRGGDVWKRGFESVGIRLAPAAVGMNSTPYKGRPACIYDGWCHVGCPIGALANPLVTYLADARQAGAQVRAHATVTRVLTNPQGNKVTGVEYFDAKKEKQVQEASVVVLAAWSAQNPRLLLNSATDKHAKGLANASGLVGKYLTAHFASGTSAIFDEDLQPYMGTTGAQYFSYDRYDKNAHKAKGAFGSTFIVAGSAQKYSGLGGVANSRGDLFGPELAAFMQRAARGLARINAERRESHRARGRQGRFRHAARQDHPQLQRRCGRAVQRQLRRGLGHRQGDRRQGGVVEPRRHADHPSDGWHDHGPELSRLSRQQLRPDPRDRQPLDRRARPLPDQRRVQSHLHDPRAFAARRRASGFKLERGRGLAQVLMTWK